MPERPFVAAPLAFAAASASILAAAVTLGLTSGCASTGGENPQAAFTPTTSTSSAVDDRELSRLSQTVAPFRDLGFELDWTVPASDTTGHRLVYFRAQGDRLFVQDERNSFTLREAATGQYRWRDQLENPVIPFVGHLRIDDFVLEKGSGRQEPMDVVVNASRTELFVRELNTGALIDRQRLAFLVNTHPLLVSEEGLLAFGSLRGRMLFHRVNADVYALQFALTGPIETDVVSVGGGVGAIADDGSAAVVDPLTGESIGGVFRLFGGSSHAPVADDQTLYVASTDQSLYALDTSTGDRRWRVRTEHRLENPVTLRDGVLYLAIPERGLVAFDANSGNVIWTTPGVTRGHVIGSIDDELICWDGRTASIIDPGSGDLMEQIDLGDVQHLSVQGFENPFLYVAFDDGRLARFRPGL